MATTLRQKKIKVEFTLTVTMKEVDAESTQNAFLQKLQQALLNDETALSRLMICAVVNQLQGYTDYLAAQDDLSPLLKVGKTLAPDEGNAYISLGSDFAEETRPLRNACMEVQMLSSTIAEDVKTTEGDHQWRPIWRDLRLESPLGQVFEKLGIPSVPVPYRMQRDRAHALRVRYITQQQDGLHIEGRCTCQEAFEGIGSDESQALDDLWSHYKAHIDACELASRFQRGWKIRLRPENQ